MRTILIYFDVCGVTGSNVGQYLVNVEVTYIVVFFVDPPHAYGSLGWPPKFQHTFWNMDIESMKLNL